MPRRNHPRKHTKIRTKAGKPERSFEQDFNEYGFFEDDCKKMAKSCHGGRKKK